MNYESFVIFSSDILNLSFFDLFPHRKQNFISDENSWYKPFLNPFKNSFERVCLRSILLFVKVLEY